MVTLHPMATLRGVPDRLFHVTSVHNRDSIEEHGLDWTYMGAARGIAGSHAPEKEGVFVTTSRFDADFFLRMNNTGGPVDLWAIDGVDVTFDTSDGFLWIPARIAREHLTLIERAIPKPVLEPSGDPSGAYRSTLTVTFADGAVLHDDAARERLGRPEPAG